MIKIVVSGIGGHMGKIVSDMIVNKQDNDMQLVAGVDKFLSADSLYDGKVKCFKSFNDVNVDYDFVIDFSHHDMTAELIESAVKNNKTLIIATTGQTEDELNMIKEASKKIPIFFAANYSLGVSILIDLAKKTAELMPDADIEIVETHHNRKIDAPSGTALAIAKALKEVRSNSNFVQGRDGQKKREKDDIGINSIRMGNIVGIHEVLISTNSQTITLKHEAHDRAVFAEGALSAAKFMVGKGAGLYSMNDIVKN